MDTWVNPTDTGSAGSEGKWPTPLEDQPDGQLRQLRQGCHLWNCPHSPGARSRGRCSQWGGVRRRRPAQEWRGSGTRRLRSLAASPNQQTHLCKKSHAFNLPLWGSTWRVCSSSSGQLWGLPGWGRLAAGKCCLQVDQSFDDWFWRWWLWLQWRLGWGW